MLLDEIQSAAIDASSDLGTLLRKCKVLAASLDSRPLEQWVLWEANGYPEDAELPDYRLLPMTLKGRFQSASHSGNGVVIPHACLPANVKDDLRYYNSRESITVIQSLISKGDEGHIIIPYSNLPLMVQGRAYPGMNCYEAWGEVSPASMLGAANVVRNRILDFVLALRKELPDMGENSSDKEVASISEERVTQIFLTVNGDHANVVGHAVNSPVTFNILPKDFKSLASALSEKGLAPADIAELEAALDTDPEPSERKFGPKVAGWIGQMMKKAADGTWKIALGAAGQILADSVWRYYDLK
jgi:hypothetical protein